jgi:hypothetical protein
MISFWVMWQIRQLIMRFMPLCKCHDGHTQYYYVTQSCHDVHVAITRNVVTQSLDREIMFNHYFRRKLWLHQPSQRSRVTKKVSLGFPMEYVEAYASRAGFVHPRDGKMLWAHSVRFHPMLQHVTRSRGWNITEWVNGNIGNKIELGMEIPTIKSRILQVSLKQWE